MRKSIIALRKQRKERGQHPGLLLQCYLSAHVTGEKADPQEKQNLFSAVMDAAVNKDVLSLYQMAFQRWSSRLPSEPKPMELETANRLVIGLGSENVLEAGLRLHHTYGMPLLPGSALKGLAAHYCDQVWGKTEQAFKKGGSYHQLLFGTTDNCGCISFYDAWLVPQPTKNPLVLDVMTPHHSEWNNLSALKSPSDFDSPTPIPFLSVSGVFLIAVTWCGPVSTQSKDWAQLTRELLRDALMDWGIGGKTTSGYGRLKVVSG